VQHPIAQGSGLETEQGPEELRGQIGGLDALDALLRVEVVAPDLGPGILVGAGAALVHHRVEPLRRTMNGHVLESPRPPPVVAFAFARKPYRITA